MTIFIIDETMILIFRHFRSQMRETGGRTGAQKQPNFSQRQRPSPSQNPPQPDTESNNNSFELNLFNGERCVPSRIHLSRQSPMLKDANKMNEKS